MANSVLAKNTMWMGVGQGLRVIVQAVYFVLIARSLGVEEYGAFVGVTALVAIIAPFASWGSGNLLIRAVATGPGRFSRYWGSALLTTAISGVLLSAVIVSVAGMVLPPTIPPGLVALIATADLLFARAAETSGQAYQAFQRLSRTAQIQLLPNLLRLAAIAVLAASIPHPTAMHWAILYCATSGIAAGICLTGVHRELARPVWTIQPQIEEFRDGSYFALSVATVGVYNDVDKAMLSRLVGFGAAGVYAAAYRIVDVAFTPVRSLLFAAYAQFFQHGEDGVRESLRFAQRLLPFAVLYGVLAAVVLFISAPLLPLLIGDEFLEAALALRWLSLLPLLKALHYFAGDTLTGSGHQGARTMAQMVVGIANVLMNLWLIPAYSWRGAAWASLAAEGLLAVLLWGTVRWTMYNERTSALLAISAEAS